MTCPDPFSRRHALLGLSALALLPVVRAQTTAAEAGPPRRANQMPAETIADARVESFALNSPAHNGEPWRIHLARPRGKAPASGHPVLTLLDGNASFPAAWHALAALRMEQPGLTGALDSLALVGIGYPSGLRIDTPRRYHDFTPYTAEEFRRARGTELVTGGRAVFLDFLAQQVREAVAARVPVDGQRQTLFGHSLGGLFTMHTLFNRPELFQNYVAGDPSLWWNGASAMQEQAAFIAGVRAAGGQLARPVRLLVENSGPDRQRDERPNQTTAAVERAATDRPGAGRPYADAPGRRSGSDTALAQLGNLQMWHRKIEEASHGAMFGPAAKDAVLFALGQVPQGARKL